MSPDTDRTKKNASQSDSDASPGTAQPPSFKVELDIDDAPFLEEAEPVKKAPEKKPEPVKKAAPPPKNDESKIPPRLKALLANKKRLAIIGGGVLVLLLAPVVIMLLTAKPPPPPREPTRIIAPGVPQREDAPAGPKYLYSMTGFLIERRGTEGEVRFIHCGFSIPTDNMALFGELNAKNIAVRDAVYYYLSNRPLVLLTNQQEREALKQDLISVVNEHISAEKITDLFFDEYLVTGK